MGVGWVRVRVTYLPPGERGFRISLCHAWHGNGLGVWVCGCRVGEGEDEGKGDVPSSR